MNPFAAHRLISAPPLAAWTPLRTDTLLVIPLTVILCLVAALIAMWAIHRLRIQHERAEELARNLKRVREESQRRLHFLNAISHDLRTPLNGVMLQTHVIEQAVQAHDEQAVREAVAGIRTASTLAAEILEALLQYARTEVEQNTLSHLKLSDLIQQVADPFRAAAEEKNVAFALTCPADLTISTDRDKLQRVLANIFANAVKFTSHGSIVVEVTAQSPQLPMQQGSVEIRVTDTGEGIAEGDQPRLFHEFFQAGNPSRDPRLGLGLGLVVARRLVEQLGGTITCTSAHHHGSTFAIQLPVQAAATPTVQEMPRLLKSPLLFTTMFPSK